MENIIQEELKGFECKRCGDCCKQEGVMADAFDDDDWELIIDYFQEKWIVIKCNCGCGEKWVGRLTNIKQIKDSKDAWLKGDYSRKGGMLWGILDKALCHFLKYHVKNHKREYYCEIEHIKPVVCAAYRCEDYVDTEDFEKLKDSIRKKRKKVLYL